MSLLTPQMKVETVLPQFMMLSTFILLLKLDAILFQPENTLLL